MLRDFQRHSAVSSAVLASRQQSESHTRLLEADDDDYGTLYMPEDESSKHNFYDFGPSAAESAVRSAVGQTVSGMHR